MKEKRSFISRMCTLMMMVFLMCIGVLRTELSADQEVVRKEAGLQSFPVSAGETIYKGAMVCVDADGYLVAAADTAGYKFAGVAYEKKENTTAKGYGSDGDLWCRVYTGGIFELTCTSIEQTMVGELMYVTDDDVVDDQSTNWICAGRLVQYVSTTQGWVDIGDRQVGLTIDLKDEVELAFGDDRDLVIDWDVSGDPHELVFMPAASTLQMSLGDASHVIYLKLHGSLAITEKELTVVMASTGDAPVTITQQASGPGLVVNRESSQAGYLLRFQINATDVFTVDGDTKIAHFTHRLKAASFAIEGGADGVADESGSGTIDSFTITIAGGIVTAFGKVS